jgi:hypothetical protein
MPKMNVNLYFIEDYENETTLRPKKTNPNKPNLRKAKNERKRSESLHFNNGNILAGKCKGGLSVTPVELLAIY